MGFLRIRPMSIPAKFWRICHLISHRSVKCNFSTNMRENRPINNENQTHVKRHFITDLSEECPASKFWEITEKLLMIPYGCLKIPFFQIKRDRKWRANTSLASEIGWLLEDRKFLRLFRRVLRRWSRKMTERPSVPDYSKHFLNWWTSIEKKKPLILS